MKITMQIIGYWYYVDKFFEKTVKFVHKSTEVENLVKDLPIIIFDENYLKNLEEKVKSREEKAANILFTLNRLILVERHKSPVYESLVDRVEKLLELWMEKTKDYQRIYREGTEIVKELDRLQRRQKELGFSNLQCSFLLTLEGKLGKKKELIKEVEKLSEIISQYMFPGWVYQATARKKIERD